MRLGFLRNACAFGCRLNEQVDWSEKYACAFGSRLNTGIRR